ncbi:MAG TPA: hypothetical protein PLK77_16300 [Pyrinomonadaceae bacterium]|nr:hypothetical protein [Pyrinomonadaceae bacterium]
MCETPKDEAEQDAPFEKKAERRSYYYDDAHGYSDYDPADEADEDDADESA